MVGYGGDHGVTRGGGRDGHTHTTAGRPDAAGKIPRGEASPPPGPLALAMVLNGDAPVQGPERLPSSSSSSCPSSSSSSSCPAHPPPPPQRLPTPGGSALPLPRRADQPRRTFTRGCGVRAEEEEDGFSLRGQPEGRRRVSLREVATGAELPPEPAPNAPSGLCQPPQFSSTRVPRGTGGAGGARDPPTTALIIP